MAEGGGNPIATIYRYLFVPFSLVAGPYYANQIFGSLSPLVIGVGSVALYDPPFWIGAAWIGASVLIGLGAITAFRWTRYRQILRSTSNPNVELLEEDCTYSILDAHTYEFEKKITFSPIIEGLTEFCVRYKWTGSGTVELLAFEGGEARIESLMDHVDDAVIFRFSTPLRRRAPHKIGLRMRFVDTSRTARPFFSTNVSHPVTDRHTMRVRFNGNVPQHCEKRIYKSPNATIPIERSKVALDRIDDEVSWPIERPKVGYRYVLEWK